RGRQRRGETVCDREVEAAVGCNAPPRGQPRRRRDQHIRRDAAATTDFAPAIRLEYGGGVFGGATFPGEGQILLEAQALVPALNHATTRGQHPGDRQHHHVTRWRQQEGRLRQRLSERAPSDDQRAIVVLERTGE